eukprot:Clim_evm1s165 gene=Clim_evmTU1s165
MVVNFTVIDRVSPEADNVSKPNKGHIIQATYAQQKEPVDERADQKLARQVSSVQLGRSSRSSDGTITPPSPGSGKRRSNRGPVFLFSEQAPHHSSHVVLDHELETGNFKMEGRDAVNVDIDECNDDFDSSKHHVTRLPAGGLPRNLFGGLSDLDAISDDEDENTALEKEAETGVSIETQPAAKSAPELENLAISPRSNKRRQNKKNARPVVRSAAEQQSKRKTSTGSIFSKMTHSLLSLRRAQKDKGPSNLQIASGLKVQSLTDFCNNYEVKHSLGHGGCGHVDMAVDLRTGEEVAIKTIEKAKNKTWSDDFELGHIPREIYMLKRLHHNGIIKILGVYERVDAYMMVMELLPDSVDLFDYIEAHIDMGEDMTRKIFRNIAEAIQHCHENGICHRDIKDPNVIINTKTLETKLVDFGSSDLYKEKGFNSFSGTREYAAPELLLGMRHDGYKAEIFSLGVLLYTICFGVNPFQEPQDTIKGIFTVPHNVSLELRHLLHWMMDIQPEMRPTMSQVLNHKWMAMGNDPEETMRAASDANQTSPKSHAIPKKMTTGKSPREALGLRDHEVEYSNPITPRDHSSTRHTPGTNSIV